jgi:hypothetical protein
MPGRCHGSGHDNRRGFGFLTLGFESQRGDGLMKSATGTSGQRTAHGFYLYSDSSSSSTLSSSNVFYWAASEQVAKTLCRLFSKEYSSEAGEPVFLRKSGDEVEQDEQVFLEEAMDWLAVYGADPDPGVYDPEPPKEMMIRAEYARRARDWEPRIVERTGGERNGPIEESTNQIPHLEAADLSPDKLQMPVEDRRNSGLNLLFLLAQAYYKILECVISTASWCCALDLKLNGSYLWTTTSLKNLLANHEDLRDFPGRFEPAFPDLYPSTIRDVDWEDTVAPDVEQFLSTVQRYVLSSGIYSPEESSPGWIFVEMFRPSVNTAIERAVAYNERMRIEAKLAGTAHEVLATQEKASQSRSQQPREPGSPPAEKTDDREHSEADRPPSDLRQRKADAGLSPHAKLTDATKSPTMTVPEVMALLHVSRSSVYRFLNEGRLDRPGLNKRSGKRSKTLVLTSSVQRMLQAAEE